MNTTRNFVRNSFQTGAVSSVTTALAVAACGQAELGNPVAPINAVSHIAWGDKRQDDLSAQYTLTGLALNSAAVTSWAAVHELFFGDAVEKGNVVGSVLGGALVSGLAYVTDYHVVTERFTPGFEKRLSNRSLLGIYTVLALSLGLGRMCCGSRGS